MGSDQEFGPETDTIRRWLEKRQTYRTDAGRHRGGGTAATGATGSAGSREAVFVTGAPPVGPVPSSAPDGHAAGRSVLDALATSGPAPAEAAAAAPEADEAAAAVPPEESSGRTTDVTFPPRTGVRRALSLILLLVLAAAAGAGYLAYSRPSVATYGVAATLGALLLAVWAVRAGSTTAEVRIHRGQLEVRRGGGLDAVDLASPYTPVAVIGTPGHRGWRVLVERPERPLLEIDASLVEPHAFMDSLLRLRPDLWEWAAANARELIGAQRDRP